MIQSHVFKITGKIKQQYLTKKNTVAFVKKIKRHSDNILKNNRKKRITTKGFVGLFTKFFDSIRYNESGKHDLVYKK